MQTVLEKVQQNEMNALVQAAESVALAFAQSTCLQISNLALLIAKRIGRIQTDATLKLGEPGFNKLIQEIKVWTGKLPETGVGKIYKANVWRHRCWNSQEEESMHSLGIHLPGTPTGADALTWAIYQVLCELGEILTSYGFNTHDIGGFYDSRNSPHLGIMFRFPWSNEMKTLFEAYEQDLAAIQRLSIDVAEVNVEVLRERACSMWDAV